MLTQEDWITARIDHSQKRHPSVPPAVFAHLHELLKGRLTERQLTPGELENVARALVAEMAVAATTTEATL